jgi:ABC-type bacteriocin/lantibiotic exporter with double-glycine peptidase domain
MRFALLAYLTLTLSPVLVFATFIVVSKRDGSEFDISRLFTSLILISLLASPFIQLFQVLPSIGAAIGCLERIQTYLDTEERTDFRRIQSSMFSTTSGDERTGQTLEKNQGATQEIEPDVVLSINSAAFAWTPSSRPALKNVSLSIHLGEHMAIIGQVGSGKSLLLNAILGQATQLEGLTSIFTTEIAYCSQTPWLENLAGMNIALRQSVLDSIWLKSVIWACALEDVVALREWSEGSIGTGGASLSGGQRQRLVGSSS